LEEQDRRRGTLLSSRSEEEAAKLKRTQHSGYGSRLELQARLAWADANSVHETLDNPHGRRKETADDPSREVHETEMQ
jgi:hypothetical protein